MSRINKQNPFFQKLLKDGPVTILKVQDQQFILEIVEVGEPETLDTITAGDIQTILVNLKREPAETIELEAAIADIEDQLMPIISELPNRRCLATYEQAFWNIAKVAGFGSDDKLQLNVDTVEEVFNRLVDVAYGTPAHWLDVPEDREFAATVLFLRELMHHASFNSIILRH
ncbi:hypothetical protein NC796_02625 [Aliifodinibius sp. S!AR15-10]|uniref:hypothetical protein n=1 Tax=Aliifodinibius sp. S!AR15-10 TaxID=2950437 RepID=UPI002864A722|nr:hypothetical protein [Aliifodinibius sp. S!AR15-10]MDR8390017.1 hypothetical protein [Aliifodinibius sp. S!AR15-10]